MMAKIGTSFDHKSLVFIKAMKRWNIFGDRMPKTFYPDAVFPFSREELLFVALKAFGESDDILCSSEDTGSWCLHCFEIDVLSIVAKIQIRYCR